MLTKTTDRIDKIEEIKRELKLKRHWKSGMPEWVRTYKKDLDIHPDDFFDWLQFIYLPNMVLGSKTNLGSNEAWKQLMPQAIEYLGNEQEHGHLVQLLIELENMV
jgi:uncharacterized protein YqcC (DUF446 family)